MTFPVYVKLKSSINERISPFRLLPEKQHVQQKPTYNVALYSVFGKNDISYFLLLMKKTERLYLYSDF